MDYEERVERDGVEARQRDDWEPYEGLGKFEGEPNVIVRLYHMMADGADEELGEADGFGLYALLLNVATSEGRYHFIVKEDDAGFVSLYEASKKLGDIKNTWRDLEGEYEGFQDQGEEGYAD